MQIKHLVLPFSINKKAQGSATINIHIIFPIYSIKVWIIIIRKKSLGSTTLNVQHSTFNTQHSTLTKTQSKHFLVLLCSNVKLMLNSFYSKIAQQKATKKHKTEFRKLMFDRFLTIFIQWRVKNDINLKVYFKVMLKYPLCNKFMGPIKKLFNKMINGFNFAMFTPWPNNIWHLLSTSDIVIEKCLLFVKSFSKQYFI